MGSSRDETTRILDRLYEIVEARRDQRPEGSYVVSLLDGGWDAMAAKVREEAEEVVVAARGESDEALAHEIADLFFHVWVMTPSRGVEPDSVYSEHARSFETGGLEQKASRGAQSVEDRT